MDGMTLPILGHPVLKVSALHNPFSIISNESHEVGDMTPAPAIQSARSTWPASLATSSGVYPPSSFSHAHLGTTPPEEVCSASHSSRPRCPLRAALWQMVWPWRLVLAQSSPPAPPSSTLLDSHLRRRECECGIVLRCGQQEAFASIFILVLVGISTLGSGVGIGLWNTPRSTVDVVDLAVLCCVCCVMRCDVMAC